MRFKSLFTSLMVASVVTAHAAIPDYDAEASKISAQNDIANWMKYLPDDVFIAHVSIPGTHDTATGEGFTSIIYASSAQTQSATIDDQLAGGVRAFDFRPGLAGSGSNQYLNCNHGIASTKLTMEAAFNKLTDYLDAHPSEFFVIHLFRGNVPNAGSSLTGGKNSDSDREKYNELFNSFFNTGKFSNYIVDYNPMLKVKDIRGKMVIFRRDRIEFAHVAKAGNMAGWPGDTEQWTENSRVSVVHASDNTIRGQITVTDVSSPANEDQLNVELSSIAGINAYTRTQTRPNEAKLTGNSYKPLWTFCFTSGEYKKNHSTGGRDAYAENASYTNPYLTSLIKDSDVKGPTGVVFSDWVLTDKYGSYATQGVDLIPAIIYNNFDYITEFILDDELFDESQSTLENYWDESKTYYMRNIATGQFLAGGLWHGTHAAVKPYGIRVTPVINRNDNCYFLYTDMKYGSAQNGLGQDMYIDNPSDYMQLQVKRAGTGRFVFTTPENKALATVPVTDNWLDGSEYSVEAVDIVDGDQAQQWELIETEDYYNTDIMAASESNGVDITYRIGRYMPNGPDNDSWSQSLGKSVSGGLVACGDFSNKMLLQFSNEKKSLFATGWNTNWSLSKDITNLPEGTYEISWRYFAGNHDDYTMTINGDDVKTAMTLNDTGAAGITAAEAVQKMQSDAYRCTKRIEITDGTIQIRAACSKSHSSATAFFLDDFKLVYYGKKADAVSVDIQKAIDDASGQIAATYGDIPAEWENTIAPMQSKVDGKDVSGTGLAEIAEVYSLMQQFVLSQSENSSDYTAAIINHSFERGDGYGWSFQTINDTDVKPNDNSIYHVDNCDGDYLFNTWDGDNIGSDLSQTITGARQGCYLLEALLTSDAGKEITLWANDASTTTTATVKTQFIDTSVRFTLDSSADIKIRVTGNNTWYKADNFRLTYLRDLSPMSVAGEYNPVDRSLRLRAVDGNGNEISDGIYMQYAVTTDNVAPDQLAEVYSGPIDLLPYEGLTVSVWAKAESWSGDYDPTGLTLIVDGMTINPMGETITYSPVTLDSQLQAGWWYMIVAAEGDSFRTVSRATSQDGNSLSCPINIGEDGTIIGDEVGFESIHEFELTGSATDGWTLVSKDRSLTLGQTASRSAAERLSIKLNDAPAGSAAVATAVVENAGQMLGFDPGTSTFGFAANHSEPVMLYTSGSAMNTGVDDICADNDSVVEYYNLQGIRVESPAAGLYIERRGNNSRKVMMR